MSRRSVLVAAFVVCSAMASLMAVNGAPGATASRSPVRRGTDRCKVGRNICHPDAVCHSTRRAFSCKCKAGFYGNGKICEDENECEYDNGDCVHFCVNMRGNYTCQCRPGFRLAADGHDCVDVDECQRNNGGCDQRCVNTLGGHECRCSDEYSLSTDGTHCVAGDLCHKRFGCSHFCRLSHSGKECACPTGYRLQANRRDCKRTCQIGNGGCAHKCTDTPSGALCSCHPKYRLAEDGATCIVTCGVKNGGCDLQCDDLPSGPKCSCPSGFILHQDGRTCIDVDECKLNNGGCSDECKNTHGHFECACPRGFHVTDDEKTCVDIDECADSNDTCDHICINTDGSFRCECMPGYEKYGETHCADRNECSDNNGGCEGRCVNTEGSYKCECEKGKRLHANKKDCIVAVECSALKSPPKTTLTCRRLAGRVDDCELKCVSPARFSAAVPETAHYTCGPESAYLWPHEARGSSLPACSDDVRAPSYKRKLSMVFLVHKCELSEKHVKEFRQNIILVLKAEKRYRCSKACSIQNVNLDCGFKRRILHKLAISSKRMAIVIASFDLQVGASHSGRFPSCDLKCLQRRTRKRLKRIARQLQKTVNKNRFFTRFAGVDRQSVKKSFRAAKLRKVCGVGQVLSHSFCVSCSVGSFYDVSSSTCQLCPAGSYQDREGQTSCKDCPHHRRGVGIEGATSARQCEAQCKPGEISRDGLQPCSPCPRGTYQPDYGRMSCQKCAHSTDTRNTGSTSFDDCLVVERCRPGEFYNRDSMRCARCAFGSYQPRSGQDFCVSCPGNTKTDYEGATNASECKDHECRMVAGQHQGYIESPNWPGQYPANVQCTWVIKPGKGRRILIVIPEIFLQSIDKCGDSLVMRKSASPYSTTTYDSCKTVETPTAFTSRSRKLWIRFKTNGKNSEKGFRIPYVTYEEDYQELIENIVRDGRLYSSYKHKGVLKNQKLLSSLLEVIANPNKYFKYANVSHAMFPESFIRLLRRKVMTFFGL